MYQTIGYQTAHSWGSGTTYNTAVISQPSAQAYGGWRQFQDPGHDHAD